MAACVEPLWTATELGAFLGLSPATVTALASRAPDRLPPRVKAIRALRWVPSLAQSWAIANSEKPRVKSGRPRLLPT